MSQLFLLRERFCAASRGRLSVSVSIYRASLLRRVEFTLADFSFSFSFPSSLTDVKSAYLTSAEATALSLIDGELVSASGTVLKCVNCLERGLRCVFVLCSLLLDRFTSLFFSDLSSSRVFLFSVRSSDSYNPSLPAPPPINRSGPSNSSSTSSTSTAFSNPPASKSLPAAVSESSRATKAKALRKGKRVLQVEDEFGAANFVRGTEGLTGSGKKIKDLTKEFLSSEFYSAFHTQREYLFPNSSTGCRRLTIFLRDSTIPSGPMLDPEDFARRFLVTDPPKAESLGPVVRPSAPFLLFISFGLSRSDAFVSLFAFSNRDPSFLTFCTLGLFLTAWTSQERKLLRQRRTRIESGDVRSATRS